MIELGDLRESITVKNYREYYHDALEHREELFTLFNLGLISLEDRAKGEVLFWDVCERADKYAQQAKYVSEEFGDLRRLLCAKYLTNFSVFRSVPDHWALDQLFRSFPSIISIRRRRSTRRCATSPATQTASSTSL